VRTQPVAESYQSVDFPASEGKNMEIPFRAGRCKHAMLEPVGLANSQYKALLFERWNIGGFVRGIGYSKYNLKKEGT
jgi:hypothetical protein